MRSLEILMRIQCLILRTINHFVDKTMWSHFSPQEVFNYRSWDLLFQGFHLHEFNQLQIENIQNKRCTCMKQAHTSLLARLPKTTSQSLQRATARTEPAYGTSSYRTLEGHVCDGDELPPLAPVTLMSTSV